MKKRMIGLISALLAVLLLAGCGSAEQAAERIAEAVGSLSLSGSQHSPGMVRFDDMEYVRPDLDALRADIAAAEEAVSAEEPVKVFVYDMAQENGAYTCGNNFTATLIRHAGGENIFSDLDTKFLLQHFQ